MKKRNKFLALILAGALSFSFAACGGADSGKESGTQDAGAADSQDTGAANEDAEEEVTAADVLAASQEKMKDIESMNAQMVMEMDMKVSADGEEQTMQTVSNSELTCLYNPMRMKAETTTDMGELGSIKQTIYAEESEDGKLKEYISDGESWQSVEIAIGDLSQYDAAKSMEYYLNDEFNFEIEGTEKVNGADAYKLTGVISGDNMKETLESSGALDSVNSLGIDASTLADIFDGLEDIPLTIWIDKENSYAVQYDADMSKTMNSLMPKVMESLGDQAQGMSMEVPKMTMKMTCSDYNAAEEFTIPEEAKQS